MPLLFVLMALTCLPLRGARHDGDAEEPSYVMLAVSGGLQDGFPDHVKLDYHAGQDDQVASIFIGRALVRGTKAYLDVMQEGWRQYTKEPDQPLVNSNVIISGCAEHANEYWVYAVDSRQVLIVLNNEPRFLSVTPDTGLVDLTSPRTEAAVRELARHEIRQQNKTDMAAVALPMVVSTWYNIDSYVPSPAIAILDDGTTNTQVTSFEGSLALWAGVNDADRTCGDGDGGAPADAELCLKAQARYWRGIRQAIRKAEANREQIIRANAGRKGPPFACQSKARLGVGPDTARINYPFTTSQLIQLFEKQWYKFDTVTGTLTSLGDGGRDVSLDEL